MMNTSIRPSTRDITTIRTDRFRYQAIKKFLDKTVNWWSIVWYIEAFAMTCLILVDIFYPTSSAGESNPYTLTNNLLIAYAFRMITLFGITILVDYITNYETSITFYIGDHLAPLLDDSMEIKLEYIKLSQELGSRPFIPYTLADMFNINRNLILSFFSAVLPLTVITLSFIRDSLLTPTMMPTTTTAKPPSTIKN